VGILVIKRARHKMHKYAVGRNRPTETRAGNEIHSQDAEFWVAKIDKASATFGADNSFKIKEISDILGELAKRIKVGEIEPEIIRNVIRRRNVSASLEMLAKRRKI